MQKIYAYAAHQLVNPDDLKSLAYFKKKKDAERCWKSQFPKGYTVHVGLIPEMETKVWDSFEAWYNAQPK